ncbi:tRNA (guanosine(37)-N1)-methyltransferase TrmD [Luteolibacter sp. AS25]|uniref:tRNA (guanosine(37)-N1)-methyltransferase TrmD n=1 Tax=Luteolibacter sp. AS25 TaxID=3135776 RepID=UPI00398B5D0D
MKIDILTLFPEIALSPLSDSIIQRARDAGLVEIQAHNLRDWSQDKHNRVDDTPCGGGPGMVLQPGPLHAAISELKQENTRVILMTPQGRQLKQAHSRALSSKSHLLIVCGHYEGIDHRIIETLIDEEISIGDYVLTNGAIAAAVLCDSIIRLLPGALGDSQSAIEESFTDPNLLEAPCYTRPVDFQGMKVPDILLSGHHKNIGKWRTEQALARTLANRPDLRENASDSEN